MAGQRGLSILSLLTMTIVAAAAFIASPLPTTTRATGGRRTTVLATVKLPYTLGPVGTPIPSDHPIRKAGFSKIFVRGDEHFAENRYQYGFSSHYKDGWMDPAAVIYAQDEDEVRKAIEYALANKVAIATRSGGHQYSGASSTAGENIQLDMTGKAFEKFEVVDRSEKPKVRVGVGFPLRVLNEELGRRGLFIPHGQCSHVHVGGHAHTGGYGQLGRAFGLFGDHIEEIEVYTAKGGVPTKITARRDSKDPEEKELFYAVLGGSPGNIGILLSLVLRVHRDEDHPNSRGLKLLLPYSKDRMQRLLQVKADMAEDPNFPPDYDFCISALSRSGDVLLSYGVQEYDMQARLFNEKYTGENYGFETNFEWPTSILLYVQFANLKGQGQAYDHTWFDKIKEAGGLPALPLVTELVHHKMSFLTKNWVLMNVREYALPYVKRTWISPSTTLSQDNWADITAERIDRLMKQDGCKIVVQIQHFGGDESRLRPKFNDPDRRTSYSWRDDTNVVATMDAFYDPEMAGAKEFAEDWEAENDDIFTGPNGCFAKNLDHRLFWASYARKSDKRQYSLDDSWQFYHESRDKYDRLLKAKGLFDPEKVFSPNPFCIGGMAKELPPVPEHFLEAEICDKEREGHTSLAKLLRKRLEANAKRLMDSFHYW